MINWNDFDIDVEELKKNIETANSGEYEEVPFGEYEVEIAKLELGVSKKNRPMLICWYRIVEGDYKGQYIFMNQLVDSGIGVHFANEFLRSLETGIEISFDTYSQYAELVDAVGKIAKTSEYAIEYGQNSKGYSFTKVMQIFTA